MEVLQELEETNRKRVEHLIDEQVGKAAERERAAIVEFIRSRVGFWNSNSNVNKKIQRLADDIADEVHHRIQQDTNGSQDS